MKRWPQRPPVEDEPEALDAYLTQVGADEEVRSFCRGLNQDGVARVDLGPEAVALCDEVAAAMDEAFAATGANRIQDGWLRSAAIRRLAINRRVKRLLDVAYARPAFAFQTLNFRVGTQQPLHSDAVHFHCSPARFMCGVWTALEDISDDAGPLLYARGSHRLPVLTMHGAGATHAAPTEEDYVLAYLPAQQRALEASNATIERVRLGKGQALVWAANLVHGGAPIRDPALTRRSLVTHFYFKGCTYYTPFNSHVEDGRLALRLPLNVKTRFVQWPVRDRRPAALPLTTVLIALRQLLERRPYSS